MVVDEAALGAVVYEAVGADDFSGAVRVDVAGHVVLDIARGFADRRHGVANEVGTRFATASATKGFTASVVVSLIVDGVLELSTPARTHLGDDLRLVDDDVTIEDLLSHRSGIGDYVDEDSAGAITDYVLAVPAHWLGSTESYLEVLEGHPRKFRRGERFSYCNSGFVILALIAERATGVPFAELVQRRVCEPAGMTRTAFERSDQLPHDAAVGYLSAEADARTNVFHLPVLGSGDGGIYSTTDDVHRFWRAFTAGAVVPAPWVAELVQPRSDVPENDMRYGLGFWLDPQGTGVLLEGYDAGVSFRSRHDPVHDVTWTVVSNTSDGAWPVVRAIADALASTPGPSSVAAVHRSGSGAALG